MNHKKANIFIRKNGNFLRLNDVTVFISQTFHDLNKGFGIVAGGTIYLLTSREKKNQWPSRESKFDYTFDESFK